MWPSLLNMLGKAGPTSGDSFTSLSAMGTPGRVQSFSAKGEITGQVDSEITSHPNLIFELSYLFMRLFERG